MGALFLGLLGALPVLARPQPGCPAGLQAHMLERLNEARARGGRCGGEGFAPAPPLQPNPGLAAAAQRHSADMAARGVFDHIGSGGSRPRSRVEAQGVSARVVAENIAHGDWGLDGVVRSWLDSPHHCRNILDGTLLEAGAGCAARTAEDAYWTLDLAEPRRPRVPRR